jgi:hypothetical protein
MILRGRNIADKHFITVITKGGPHTDLKESTAAEKSTFLSTSRSYGKKFSPAENNAVNNDLLISWPRERFTLVVE